MPEKRMGHIAEARQTKGSTDILLATNPADRRATSLEEPAAEVRGDCNTVLVHVNFDQAKLHKVIADPKIGASATAKIHCGKRAIGYVWFHDLVDFIRAKILFRIF
jgi:hypothetical protein